MSKKILVIEDEPGIRFSLEDEFESLGYTVFIAEDGEDGFELAEKEQPDIIILDIMLPVYDGYEVCKKLRMAGNRTPIIMLTVKDQEIDKVLGLELGADDYVTKPFSLRELVARVKAILRRTEQRSSEITHYKIGEIEFNFKKFEAEKSGKSLEFTPLEYQMLKLLIKKKEQVVSRDDFLNEIWGEDNMIVTTRTIDSHIANIRKKIEKQPSEPRYIVSIRGVGYKLIA